MDEKEKTPQNHHEGAEPCRSKWRDVQKAIQTPPCSIPDCKISYKTAGSKVCLAQHPAAGLGCYVMLKASCKGRMVLSSLPHVLSPFQCSSSLSVLQHFLRQQLPPAHCMQPYLYLLCLFKFHLDPQTNGSPREGILHFGCVLQDNEMCRRNLRCSFSSNLYQGPREHDSQRLVLPLGLESSWTLPRDTGRTGECSGLSTAGWPCLPNCSHHLLNKTGEKRRWKTYGLA